MELRYGPPRAAGPVLLVLAAVLAAAGWRTDAPGRLLAGVAVAGLLGAAGWTLGGPALRADAAGVRVRSGLRRYQVPWPAVRSVRADTRRRSAAVELDTELGLLAVPAVLLGGAGPAEVAAELNQLRAAGQAG